MSVAPCSMMVMYCTDVADATLAMHAVIADDRLCRLCTLPTYHRPVTCRQVLQVLEDSARRRLMAHADDNLVVMKRDDDQTTTTTEGGGWNAEWASKNIAQALVRATAERKLPVGELKQMLAEVDILVSVEH